MHVATSTIDKLVDYVMNTAKDGLTSSASVQTLNKIIDKNLKNEAQTKKKNNDKSKVRV
jgi:4-O-beta-D-mannosyl-D-glucose phosphorylase